MPDKPQPNPASTDGESQPPAAARPIAGRLRGWSRPFGKPAPSAPGDAHADARPSADADKDQPVPRPLSLRDLLDLPRDEPPPGAASGEAGPPPLRLVGEAAGPVHRAAPPRKPELRPHVEQALQPPISATADPRWILAVRTAEYLQGDRIPPVRRERILRLAASLRMPAFDANLIIAIIQLTRKIIIDTIRNSREHRHTALLHRRHRLLISAHRISATAIIIAIASSISITNASTLFVVVIVDLRVCQ